MVVEWWWNDGVRVVRWWWNGGRMVEGMVGGMMV